MTVIAIGKRETVDVKFLSSSGGRRRSFSCCRRSSTTDDDFILEGALAKVRVEEQIGGTLVFGAFSVPTPPIEGAAPFRVHAVCLTIAIEVASFDLFAGSALVHVEQFSWVALSGGSYAADARVVARSAEVAGHREVTVGTRTLKDGSSAQLRLFWSSTANTDVLLVVTDPQLGIECQGIGAEQKRDNVVGTHEVLVHTLALC